MGDQVVKTDTDRKTTSTNASCRQSEPTISMLVALSNQCLSEAICALMQQLTTEYQVYHLKNATDDFEPHILLTDYSGLILKSAEDWPEARILVFDDGLDDSQKQHVFAYPRVMGLVRKDCDIDLFLKAITCVMDGQVWIDSQTATNIIRNRRQPSLPGASPFLSKRERTILDLILQGCRNKEIAGEIFLSESTVKFYVSRILKKYKVPTRSQLIAKISGTPDYLH